MLTVVNEFISGQLPAWNTLAIYKLLAIAIYELESASKLLATFEVIGRAQRLKLWNTMAIC